MKNCILILFVMLCSPILVAQQGFEFKGSETKVTVPFKLINNLVFVPIKVNGVELNFLLDTGVSETILFSLEEKKEVRFFDAERVMLKGLGNQTAVEGLKSANNILDFGRLQYKGHFLYIVLDPEFNLSSHIGIPVNGIIGYHFFKNNLIQLDYRRKKIVVLKDTPQNRKKYTFKTSIIPLQIDGNKPYVIAKVDLEKQDIPVKLLVDIGNSDAVWLFHNRNSLVNVPKKNFNDFLGRGFSGDVEGQRAKVKKFKLADYTFDEVISAFPDSISIKNVTMVPDRMGSVGGEIMKRFKVLFDYSSQQMFLRKNKAYYEPFSYNKSGIEIQHHGLQWVQETVQMETVPESGYGLGGGKSVYMNDFKYKFKLKPVYDIAHIRQDSPAALAGLQKGDVLVRINNRVPYQYSLEQINQLFKSEEDKWITLEIERKSQLLTFSFQLENKL
ncbi:PDZ domain-containing protein [Flavobacterium turcicum]|uniref:Aspartyl protease family protein n=1 Tax=Flavobacterium turcicum TaxID=2764718 RepID=A0ABR7JGV9_9FLAO|nr:PDZ domain-containing protein [Flavobacterium turcicum]MBC5863486.1 aspartyl protease family protein [Flavobacterium turcicum]NHL02564.1 PDZ domain-containing protein [Flavobacterium turcicum]